MNRRRGNGAGLDRGGVPPRWLKCPRKSTGLVGDKFLVFKTPLSSQYDDYVPIVDRFPPSMVIKNMKSSDKNLGLWIDLTNTDRYYPKSEIEQQGITYMKIQCQGADGAPNEQQRNLFVRLCTNFIDKNPDSVIGVHCTHGFNRSGFLICAFLVEREDWGIDAAISEFSRLRPPGIYKQDYLNTLWEIYGDKDEPLPPPAAPVKPDWCFEDEHVRDDDGFTTGQQSRYANGGAPFMNNNTVSNKRPYNLNDQPSTSRPHSSKRRRDDSLKEKQFMEGVTGVHQITEATEARRVQSKVQDMCGWTEGGFPGSQPVSMDRTNIHLLADHPYMVSWKADGTRYLMLIEDHDRIYFLDRDNCVFKVEGMTFPYRKQPGEFLTETLADGEMVIDKHEGKEYPRYLIYDIIKFRGEDVGKTEFRTRLTCIQKEIVDERYKAISKGEINRESEPFGVRLKQFWYLDSTEGILRGKLTKELSHEPDGAVFQPIREPYICGRCDVVLKWKPPSLNTIDFRLMIRMQTGEGLLPTRIGELYVGSLSTPFSMLKKLTKDVAKLDGRIIECRYNNGWEFLRERTDKSFPNAYSTAQAVLNSIKNPVDLDYLLDFIHRHRFRKFGGL